jgi:hypothetical protein
MRRETGQSRSPFTGAGAAGPESLGAALEAALMRELASLYATENWLRFGNRLRMPVLALSDSTTRLGAWIRATRTLELARALVLDRPWVDVVSVLQHEMAHQYVDEVLGVHDECPHGDTFRQLCAALGIDGRASGAPSPAAGAAPTPDRVLARVRKLLALAASSNQHEAETAMQRAHELMLRHNLEAADATAERTFEVRHVGDPSRRGTQVEAAVVALLSEFFFVRALRLPVYLPRAGKRGHVYELTGTHANLELAVYVHAFLLATAERLWREHRADPRVGGRDRLAYQTGVIRGFQDKLRADRRSLAGTGLVWRPDAALTDFFHRRNPRTRARRSPAPGGAAHLAGREAGARVILHRPIDTAGGATATPRLLRA